MSTEKNPAIDGNGQEATRLSPEEMKEKFGIYNLAQLEELNRNLPPTRYLIQDLIADSSLHVCIGDSHVGKSPFWFQVCITIAGGLPDFLGRTCYTKNGTPVLYLNYEDNTPDIHNRFKDMNRVIGLDGYPLSLTTWNRRGDEGKADKSDPIAWLDKILQAGQYKLIIIDPIINLFPTFGKDYATTNNIAGELRKLQTKCNCAFVAMHHLRKTNTNAGGEGTKRLSECRGAAELNLWFEKAMDSKGITTAADVRIGMDFEGVEGKEVMVRGFEKGKDEFPLLKLSRIRDEFGDPIAYAVSSSLDQFDVDQRRVWDALEEAKEYESGDLSNVWGEVLGETPSKSKLYGFIKMATGPAQAMRHSVPPGKVHGPYSKLVPSPTKLRCKFKPQTWLEEIVYHRHKTPNNTVVVRHTEEKTETGVRGEFEMRVETDQSAGFTMNYEAGPDDEIEEELGGPPPTPEN